ncbi:hypothetical protein SDC9_176069 [bioreactor metagenome]|uniref:Uncharacterized protein n=1 Tax=bioreactor metagenome TaxID=1076179 RepID=A0A645GR24_9ZZZZ
MIYCEWRGPFQHFAAVKIHMIVGALYLVENFCRQHIPVISLRPAREVAVQVVAAQGRKRHAARFKSGGIAHGDYLYAAFDIRRR